MRKKNNESIPIGRQYDGSMMYLEMMTITDENPGPVLFLSGAIHGDELCGPAIIRKLLQRLPKKINGKLILVPIVNPFGFNSKSRYLPDRKDLNRSFPGSKNGSLAGRLAHVFTEKVLSVSDYGIDFHSAGIHKVNIPQIRIGDQSLLGLAKAFNAPLTLDSKIIKGSMRETANSLGVKVLLFEGDECLHVDERVTNEAVDGTLSVMAEIGMIDTPPDRTGDDTFHARSSYWVRAPFGGILTPKKKLGSVLKYNDIIATISDPFGVYCDNVRSPSSGVLLGMTKIPLCNEGDSLFHIATVRDLNDLRDVLDDLVEFEEL